MKKAIVTGATGFIGAAFVEYLNCRGVEVLALGRKQQNEIRLARRNRLRGAKYLQLDMNDISCLPEVLKEMGWKAGSECVFFNLAWGGERGLSDLNVAAQLRNVTQAVSALEVASQTGCVRFIQVGTMEEAFTQKYLELDHQQHTQYNRHVIYSVAKMAARQALEVKASQLGMDFIYVLHSHVMGPDDDKDSFLQVTLQKLIAGEDLIFSSGEQYFDVVSLEDCALGYYLICKKGKPGKTYWVGSGEPQRLRKYVERMYALFPSEREMQFGKLSYNDIVLDKEVFSIASLIQDTGYQPTMTFEETVKALHEHLLTLTSDNKGNEST
jgi:nucleoside-diphosphate-sugar epimerase